MERVRVEKFLKYRCRVTSDRRQRPKPIIFLSSIKDGLNGFAKIKGLKIRFYSWPAPHSRSPTCSSSWWMDGRWWLFCLQSNFEMLGAHATYRATSTRATSSCSECAFMGHVCHPLGRPFQLGGASLALHCGIKLEWEQPAEYGFSSHGIMSLGFCVLCLSQWITWAQFCPFRPPLSLWTSRPCIQLPPLTSN
jgi:hypothetical protein